VIEFTIPAALPSLNVRDRMHWSVRQRQKRDLAWAVWAAVAQFPGVVRDGPWDRTRVTITRCSAGELDPDNLAASAKPMLDVLCPVSKTHPYGLGLIVDDAPAHCELVVRQEKAKRKNTRTVVRLERIE
jgi:hypothetical protein